MGHCALVFWDVAVVEIGVGSEVTKATLVKTVHVFLAYVLRVQLARQDPNRIQVLHGFARLILGQPVQRVRVTRIREILKEVCISFEILQIPVFSHQKDLAVPIPFATIHFFDIFVNKKRLFV